MSSLETTVPNVTSFKYIKNDIDLTEYALDFITQELKYYNDMLSYTLEDEVTLFICVNGLISSVATYDSEDGRLTEYFRNDNSVDNKFNSIKEWYNDYYGESVTIDKVLNNVFIGEDLVPLWKVLVDTKEEEDCESDYTSSDDDSNNLITKVNVEVSMSTFDRILIYSFLALNLLSFIGYIIVSVV